MTAYETSHIKRTRATRDEVEARRRQLYYIVALQKPMTVRQVFYQATVRGVVEKSEAGYAKVQTDLVQMRRAGVLPYAWVTDNTRSQRRPRTFGSIEEALDDTARFYRKALWDHTPDHVEIWIEKDALSGVVIPVTAKYDVPLMVARGYASLSFLHSAAEYMATIPGRCFVYHLGDFDPSGVNAGEKIEQTLRELAPGARITFQRLAVNEEQIAAWRLPSRPTKKTDSRAKNFGDVSVELDAIAPDQLRQMVRDAIEKHLPPDQYRILMAAEESERQLLTSLISGLDTGEARP